MANDLRTIELLIKAAVDQGASQQTQAQLQDLKLRLEDIQNSSAGADQKTKALGATMATIKANPEFMKIAGDVKRITDASREANAELAKMSGQGGPGGGRFGGGIGPGGLGFSEFLGGMAVRALPQGPVGQVLGSSLLGAGSINSIIDQIKMMSKEMGGLGGALSTVITGLGPVTAGFLLLNTVVAVLNHANEEAKTKLEAVVEGLRLYYKTIEEGTTESINREAARREQDIRTQQKVIADLESQRQALGQPVGREGFKNELVAQRNALNSQLDEERKKLEQLNKEHEGLLKARDSETVKLRDAAIARTKASQLAVEQAIEGGQLSRTGSSSSVVEEMARLDDEMNGAAVQIAKVNDLIKSGLATPEDLENRKRLIEELNAAAQRSDFLKTLLPGIQAREREEQAIKDALKAQDERNKALERETNELKRIQQQIDDLQADRDKQLRRQAEDDAIQAERIGIEREMKDKIRRAKEAEAEEDYQARIAKIKDSERMQERRLTEGYQRQVDKINSEFMENELAATQKFRDKQADDLAKFNKRYARALEDMQDRLMDAASRRDVAGFIQAQRDGEKQLRRIAEDFADQEKEQATHFLKERAAARDNREKQLREAERAYREQLQLLRDQLEERLQQEREAHQRRVRQSEQLEAQLQHLREQWQIRDNMRRRAIEEEDFNERMNILRTKLNEQRGLIMQLFANTATAPLKATSVGQFISSGISTVSSIGQNLNNLVTGLFSGGQPLTGSPPTVKVGASTPSSRQNRNLLPDRFQSGLDFVPHDFYPALLDRGERVLTAQENMAYSSGRPGGSTIMLDMRGANFGGADPRTIESRVYKGVAMAFDRAKRGG